MGTLEREMERMEGILNAVETQIENRQNTPVQAAG
jgi:hypothetical protein